MAASNTPSRHLLEYCNAYANRKDLTPAENSLEIVGFSLRTGERGKGGRHLMPKRNSK
jgi:hypothetical protein